MGDKQDLATIRLWTIRVLSVAVLVISVAMVAAMLQDLVGPEVAVDVLVVSMVMMFVVSVLIDFRITRDRFAFSRRGPKERSATRLALVAVLAWFIYLAVVVQRL